VLNLTFALNYALSGTSAWSYHALNLLIHMLASLTLFGVVRRTLQQPVLRERFGAGATLLAFAAALLWTVHPLQTQAVTYVVQRAESLMGLFFLLTLYGFIRGTETGASRWWLVLSFTACLLGMGTKEVTAVAPWLVLLYDRTFVSGTLREAWRRRRRFYGALAATWLMQWPLIASLGRRDPTSGFGSIPWGGFVWTQFQSIVHYLKLSIWPHPLIFYLESIKDMTGALPCAIIIMSLVAGTVVALWLRPAAGFLGAWFFIILAPTSLVPGTCEPMAERRMYLPLAVVMVAVVTTVYAWVGRRGLVVFMLAAASALAATTIRRNEDYHSELAIWRDTVDKCPQEPIDHYMYGSALMGAGRWQEAIDQFNETLRRRPEIAEAHISLGLVLMAVKNYPAAILQLEAALRLRPNDTMVHNSLGIAMFRVGMTAEAVGQFKQALLLDPNLAAAENNLGAALLQLGQPLEGRKHFERALQLDPAFAQARQHLEELNQGKASP
jgi:protein O-mannosyl-transferase